MPTAPELGRPVEILLVEDSLSDAGLTMVALNRGHLKTIVRHVEDGVEALAYLRKEAVYQERRRPDLVLLDLNMPRKDGREVLKEVRSDARLKYLPIVILTTSDAEKDVQIAYGWNANAYIKKSVDLETFTNAMHSLDRFFLTHVVLPDVG